VPVGVELVDEDGTLLATVPAEITLPVPLDVELGYPAWAGHRVLEDAGKDRPSLPGHVFRETDVHGHQPAHAIAGSPKLFLLRLRAHAPVCRTRSATRRRGTNAWRSRRIAPRGRHR